MYWRPYDPRREKAHGLVYRALKAGKLKKPTKCEGCGAEGKRLQGHHDDYDKPLDVRWLCPKCHSRWTVDHASITQL